MEPSGGRAGRRQIQAGPGTVVRWPGRILALAGGIETANESLQFTGQGPNGPDPGLSTAEQDLLDYSDDHRDARLLGASASAVVQASAGFCPKPHHPEEAGGPCRANSQRQLQFGQSGQIGPATLGPGEPVAVNMSVEALNGGSVEALKRESVEAFSTVQPFNPAK